MKKLLSIFMAVLMCFLMAGCSDVKDEAISQPEEQKEAFSPDSFLRNAADILSELEEAELYADGFTTDLFLNLSVSEKGQAFFTEIFGVEEDYVNWIESIGIDATLATKDNAFSIAAAAVLNNVDLLSLDVAYEDGTLYYSLPDYSDKAIKIYDTLPENISLGNINILSYVDISLVQSILDNYLNIVADNVEFEEKKANKTVNGISAELTSYELVIDSNLMLAVCQDLIPAMQNDSDLEDLMYQIADYAVATFEYSGEEIYIDGEELYYSLMDGLDYLTESMEEYDEADNYTLGTLSLYADSEGNFTGFNFINEYGETFELLNIFSGNDYGFTFVVTDGDYTPIEVCGNGTKTENQLDAEFTIYTEDDGAYSFNIYNLDLKQFAEGSLCGEFKFPLPTIYDIDDLSLYLDLYEADSEATVEISLLEEDEALFTLETEAEVSSDATINIPEKTVDSDDEIAAEKWLNAIMIKIAPTIPSKLKEAKVPQKIINEIVSAFM